MTHLYFCFGKRGQCVLIERFMNLFEWKWLLLRLPSPPEGLDFSLLQFPELLYSGSVFWVYCLIFTDKTRSAQSASTRLNMLVTWKGSRLVGFLQQRRPSGLSFMRRVNPLSFSCHDAVRAPLSKGLLNQIHTIYRHPYVYGGPLRNDFMYSLGTITWHLEHTHTHTHTHVRKHEPHLTANKNTILSLPLGPIEVGFNLFQVVI